MLDAIARLDEAIVKSIVDGLPEEGSILVPRLRGVRRHMELLLSSASAMDLPALLGWESLSHMVWWPLKSPPIRVGFCLLKKGSMSVTSQSPLGTYMEIRSIWELLDREMLAPIASMVAVGVKLKGENLMFFLMRIATPPPALWGRSSLRTW